MLMEGYTRARCLAGVKSGREEGTAVELARDLVTLLRNGMMMWMRMVTGESLRVSA